MTDLDRIDLSMLRLLQANGRLACGFHNRSRNKAPP